MSRKVTFYKHSDGFTISILKSIKNNGLAKRKFNCLSIISSLAIDGRLLLISFREELIALSKINSTPPSGKSSGRSTNSLGSRIAPWRSSKLSLKFYPISLILLVRMMIFRQLGNNFRSFSIMMMLSLKSCFKVPKEKEWTIWLKKSIRLSSYLIIQRIISLEESGRKSFQGLKFIRTFCEE